MISHTIKAFKHAILCYKIDNHLEKEEFFEALGLLNSVPERRRSVVRFFQRKIEALFFSGQIAESELIYHELVRNLISRLDSGKLNKRDLLWVVEYCLKRYGFQFTGISEWIDVDDREPKKVARSIRRSFPMID